MAIGGGADSGAGEAIQNLPTRTNVRNLRRYDCLTVVCTNGLGSSGCGGDGGDGMGNVLGDLWVNVVVLMKISELVAAMSV